MKDTDPASQDVLKLLIKGLMDFEKKTESSKCHKLLARCIDSLSLLNLAGSEDAPTIICRVSLVLLAQKLINEQQVLMLLNKVIPKV